MGQPKKLTPTEIELRVEEVKAAVFSEHCGLPGDYPAIKAQSDKLATERAQAAGRQVRRRLERINKA